MGSAIYPRFSSNVFLAGTGIYTSLSRCIVRYYKHEDPRDGGSLVVN